MTASENNEVAKHRRSQTKVCVTGAWLEGDDPGDRKFIKIGDLTLESGEVLPDITIAYQTWGTINEARDKWSVTVEASRARCSEPSPSVWSIAVSRLV